MKLKKIIIQLTDKTSFCYNKSMKFQNEGGNAHENNKKEERKKREKAGMRCGYMHSQSDGHLFSG